MMRLPAGQAFVVVVNVFVREAVAKVPELPRVTYTSPASHGDEAMVSAMNSHAAKLFIPFLTRRLGLRGHVVENLL
jgi:hypothetical protein